MPIFHLGSPRKTDPTKCQISFQKLRKNSFFGGLGGVRFIHFEWAKQSGKLPSKKREEYSEYPPAKTTVLISVTLFSYTSRFRKFWRPQAESCAPRARARGAIQDPFTPRAPFKRNVANHTCFFEQLQKRFESSQISVAGPSLAESASHPAMYSRSVSQSASQPAVSKINAASRASQPAS